MMVTHTPFFAELLDAVCKLAIAPSIVHPAEMKERVIRNFVLNLQRDSADNAIIYDRFTEMSPVPICPLIYSAM
jgi:hypothetical protein